MTLPPIGANAELNLDRWTRNVQQMLRDAEQADAAIQGLVDALNRVQSSVDSSFGGGVGLTINVDDSEIESAVDLQALLLQNTSFIASADDSDIATATDLQAALEQNTAFVAGVDEAEIDAARRLKGDLETNVAFRVNVDDAEIGTAKRDHDDLEQNTSFRAGVDDTEIDQAKRKREDLDANTSMKVNVDDSEVNSMLRQIQALQAVDIAINVAQPAVDFVREVGNLSVGSLFEMDTAMAQLEGRTGRMVPGAERLIRDLYVNGWGESRTQIGEVITAAVNLGIEQDNLDKAVETAFQVAQITGEETTAVLEAEARLVQSRLVPDYEQAADLIVLAFQNGANRSEDVLDTINEYTPDFTALGFTGEQIATVMINGVKAGFMNTDTVGDALREFKILAQGAISEEMEGAWKKIDLFDELELFRQGDLAGTELLSGAIAAINNLPVSEQPEIATILFGTKIEDFGLEAMQGLDPLVESVGALDGKARRASDVFNNNLPQSLENLKRFAEEEIAGFLNEAFDIEGAIDDAKANLQTFFNEMRSGTGLFEALEISFNVGGLQDTMEMLQRTFADVGLAFLEAVRAILSIFDKGAAESVEGLIADLATVQLGADIFAADSQENVVSAIKRALDRGADEAEIGQKIVDHVRALQASGDLQGALQFVDLIDAENVFNVDLLRGQIIQDMNNAVNQALDSGDLRTAFELAPTVEIRQTFADQMKTDILRLLEEPFKGFNERQDLINFTQILSNSTGAIDFEVLKTNVGEEGANQIVEGLRSGFADAVNSGQFALALDYAELLGEQNLIDTVDILIGEMDRLGDPRVLTATEALNTDIVGLFAVVDDTATNISESGEDIGGTFEELSEDSRNVRKNVETEVQGMGKAIDIEAGNIDRHGRDMSKTFDDVDRDAGLMNKGASLEFRTMAGDFDDAALDMEGVADHLASVLDEQLALASEDMQTFANVTDEQMDRAADSVKDFVIYTSETAVKSLSTATGDMADLFTDADDDIETALESILDNIDAFITDSNTLFGDLEDTTGVILGNVRDDFVDLSDAAVTMGEKIGGAVQDAEDEFLDFRTIWHDRTLTMGDEFSAFVDRTQTDTQRLIDTLLEAQRQIQAINLTPPGSGGGAAPGSTGGGGRGFQETESALGAFTTADFQSISSVSNTSSSVSNISVNYNFYTNSTAQDLSMVGSTGSQLRGFN